MEISDLQRESVLGELRLIKSSNIESHLLFYDEKDQILGEMSLNMKIQEVPEISTSIGG